MTFLPLSSAFPSDFQDPQIARPPPYDIGLGVAAFSLLLVFRGNPRGAPANRLLPHRTHDDAPHKRQHTTQPMRPTVASPNFAGP